MLKEVKNIHLVGICGSGMSGIAEVLHNLGFKITGSDIGFSSTQERLEEIGIKIYPFHSPLNLGDAQLVVYSNAIDCKSNPEICAARKLNIPLIPRAQMLAELMQFKYSIVVAGSHGKTSITSLAGFLIYLAKLDPTLVIGGKFKNINSNAHLGRGNYFVAEADESDGSFLKFNPNIAIVSNIDDDHLDFYQNMEALKKSFLEFINKVKDFCIICGDDSNIKSIIPFITSNYYTYGIEQNNDFRAVNIKISVDQTSYSLYYKDKFIKEFSLCLKGKHNILNSLAVAALGIKLGLPLEIIQQTFTQFKGVERRLEIKGEKNGLLVIDDYGHHPTEIGATLEAIEISWPERRKIAVFQPHRYSRTKLLAQAFAAELEKLDLLYLVDIYPASEQPIPGVSSQLILDYFKDKSKVKYIKDKDVLIKEILQEVKPGDIFLTLGAGNVWKIGEEILQKYGN